MGEPIKNKVFYTYEEYIALEQDSDIRYEYYYGEVFAMAGGSLAHNDIVTNMVASLKPSFRGKGCKLYAENVKLELTPQEFYVYPDIMILCKADEVEDDLVKSPTLIIEVLSKSTQAYDLGTKLNHYIQIPSLQYYLQVSQTAYEVGMFERRNELWVYSMAEGLQNSVYLADFDLSIPLAEIYEDIALSRLKKGK